MFNEWERTFFTFMNLVNLRYIVKSCSVVDINLFFNFSLFFLSVNILSNTNYCTDSNLAGFILSILDKKLIGIRGVRLDSQKVLRTPGSRTKYFERLFFSFNKLNL